MEKKLEYKKYYETLSDVGFDHDLFNLKMKSKAGFKGRFTKYRQKIVLQNIGSKSQ